jgi:hypothetical protein
MDELAADTLKETMRTIGERPTISRGQRLFVERVLPQADELWRKTRDLECGPLAAFETALPGDTYERRLRCLIRADRERIAILKARFGKVDRER